MTARVRTKPADEVMHHPGWYAAQLGWVWTSRTRSWAALVDLAEKKYYENRPPP